MADTAYSVSPGLRARTTGPKPIEKRSTSTPNRLATAKCPSSCTKTSTPIATENASTVTKREWMSIITFSGPWQDGVVVREHDGEEEAVQPVQNATVSRDNPAGVLGSEGALEGRLAEVAELRQHADCGAQHERLAAPQLGEEDEAADRRDHHRAGERAERALDRLARADRGGEWVAAEGAAGEVATRVRSHRRVDGEQHPAPALSVQQHEVGCEEANVEHAQEGEPEAMHGTRQIIGMEQREHEPANDRQPETGAPQRGLLRGDAAGDHEPPQQARRALHGIAGQRHGEVLEQAHRRHRHDEAGEQGVRELPDDQPEGGQRDGRGDEPGAEHLINSSGGPSAARALRALRTNARAASAPRPGPTPARLPPCAA